MRRILKSMRRLANKDRTSLAYLTASIVRGGAVGLLFIWIAVRLGGTDFGRLAFLLAVARLSAPFASPGSAWSVQSRMSAGASVKSAMRPSLKRSLLSVIVVTVTLLVALELLAPGTPRLVAASIIIGSLGGQVAAATTMPVLLFQQREVAVLFSELSRPLLQVGGIGAVLTIEPTLASVAVAFGMANVVWAGAVLVAVYRLETSLGAKELPAESGVVAQESARVVLKIASSQTLRSGSYSIDQVMMPAFVTFSELGKYSLAAQFASFAVLAIGSVGGSRQRVLYLATERDLPSVALRESRRLALFSLPMALTLLVGSTVLSTFLEVVDTQVILLTGVLLVAAVFLALGYPLVYAMTSRGDHDNRFKVEVLALAVNVVMNLVLLYFVGPIGAALATVCSELALAAAARHLVLVM